MNEYPVKQHKEPSNQDKHRRHDWGAMSPEENFPSGEIVHERCRRCGAKRVVQYPPGMILRSEPSALPKFCAGVQY